MPNDINTQITRIMGNVAAAYTAALAKGATMPQNQNSDNLADTVATIPEGGGVTVEPLSVFDNGIYTAPTGKAYSPVTVGVPQGIPIDVSTSAGMTAVLTAANAGRAFRFTGTTDSTYTNGDIYVVEVT